MRFFAAPPSQLPGDGPIGSAKGSGLHDVHAARTEELGRQSQGANQNPRSSLVSSNSSSRSLMPSSRGCAGFKKYYVDPVAWARIEPWGCQPAFWTAWTGPSIIQPFPRAVATYICPRIGNRSLTTPDPAFLDRWLSPSPYPVFLNRRSPCFSKCFMSSPGRLGSCLTVQCTSPGQSSLRKQGG